MWPPSGGAPPPAAADEHAIALASSRSTIAGVFSFGACFWHGLHMRCANQTALLRCTFLACGFVRIAHTALMRWHFGGPGMRLHDHVYGHVYFTN